MPVYNGAKYIAQAIESIGFQSFSDWELIIVDDGSTDETKEIISRYRDNRIYYFKNDRNRGLIYSRNKLIELASGEYIAFLDSDDLAEKRRLKAQVEFLDKHPHYAMCGTWAHLVQNRNTIKKIRLPSSHQDIKCTLLFTSTFVHSSVMIRREVLKENPYNPDFPLAEDYELWCRISKRYKLANLSRYLTGYRTHDTNISNSKKKELDKLVREILRRELAEIGIQATEEELTIHAAISHASDQEESADIYLPKLKKWLIKLQKHALSSGKYNRSMFQAVVAFRWIFACKMRKANSAMFRLPARMSIKAYALLLNMLFSRI